MSSETETGQEGEGNKEGENKPTESTGTNARRGEITKASGYIAIIREPSANPLLQQSLAAVHLACQSLLRDECNLALVGGAQLLLTPEITMGFCKALMLSPTETCRAFDAGANGYVGSYGVDVVVLKHLARSIRTVTHRHDRAESASAGGEDPACARARLSPRRVAKVAQEHFRRGAMRIFKETMMLHCPDAVVSAFLREHGLRDRVVEKLALRFRGGRSNLEF